MKTSLTCVFVVKIVSNIQMRRMIFEYRQGVNFQMDAGWM